MSNEENGKSETNSPNNHDLETSETHIPELDNPITEQEFCQAIRNMKHGKASGIDEICGEFLKYAENVVVPFLTQLFNNLYGASLFPEVWSKLYPFLRKVTMIIQTTIGESLYLVSLARFSLLF